MRANNLFWRGGAENLLLLRPEPLGPKQPDDNLLRNILGNNLHGNIRYSSLANLFDIYQSSTVELFYRKKLYLESDYVRLLLSSRQIAGGIPRKLLDRVTRERNLEKIVRERVTMFENFSAADCALVPLSKSKKPSAIFHYYDVPWAIDYLGHSKARDGAHRRATLFYLGRKSVPTLVVNFEAITKDFVQSLTQNKAVTSGFEKYRKLVWSLAQGDRNYE